MTKSTYGVRTLPVLAVLFAWCGAAGAQGIQPQVRNFYVGQYGSSFSTAWENNSALQPFQTMQTALTEVRDFLSTTPSHGQVNVLVAGGEYHVEEPLVFTAADSGNANYPINWIAWNGAPHQASNDDVLICGGVHLNSGWSVDNTVSITNGQAWKMPLSAHTQHTLTAPRDLWYDGRRMIRSRFPNPPESSGGNWNEFWVTTPASLPPHANEGFLVVSSMIRDEQNSTQTLVIENGDDHGGTPRTYELPEIESWVGVELSAFNGYVAPRQIIDASDDVEQGDEINQGFFRKLTVEFDIDHKTVPNSSPTAYQDVGGLGPFDLDQQGFANGHLEVWKSAQPDRGAQIVLENHFKFLDRVGEWYCGAENLWIALPCDVEPYSENGSPGVVFPLTDKLLVLDGTSYVTFTGIDFAYSDMPFPTQGWPGWTEPGYASVQSGWNWQEGNNKHDITSALPASIDLRGAKHIDFEECRFGHFGGSGISIGERVVGTAPNQDFFSSSDNTFHHCEVLDVGGHGINIGDQRTQQTNDQPWATGDDPDYAEPHERNSITECYIWQYGVTYKDGTGILIAHTRDTTISDNKIELGNWSGMAIGGIQRYRYNGTQPSACTNGGTANWPQANEHLIVRRNYIHKGCLRLNDGGGIYAMGVQESATSTPSELDGNYVLRIDHDPYKNYTHKVMGLYFDGGSGEWVIKNNVVALAQFPFRFAAKTDDGQAQYPNEAGLNWGAGAWPIPWIPSCNLSTPVKWPGQTWNDQAPNWWWEPDTTGETQDGYASVQNCPGHYPLSHTMTVDGIQYNLNFPPDDADVDAAENWTFDELNDIGPATTIGAAGPANFSTWFPGAGDQIYILPYRPCGGEGGQYVEIEWPY